MKIHILLIFIFFCPVTVLGHGTSGSIRSGAIVVSAEYDDGSPMAYSETEIMAPDSDIPFSSGWTDRNGRFCFYPDSTGEYRVRIADGIGHMLEMKVPVNADMKAEGNKAEKRSGGTASPYENLLMGLSLIFFLFGFMFWRKGRKSPAPA